MMCCTIDRDNGILYEDCTEYHCAEKKEECPYWENLELTDNFSFVDPGESCGTCEHEDSEICKTCTRSVE